MDFVETEGETIDQAIDNALKQLGVARDRITVDIIAEGKKGILGFGAQKARIRASLRKSTIDLTEAEPATVTEQAAAPAASSPTQPTAMAPAATPAITEAMVEKARTVLGDILRLMEVDATVTAKGIVKDKIPEGDEKIRVVCEVWVETDDGRKSIVGTCSGLVPKSRS